MADCNNLFSQYNSLIRLSDYDRNKLTETRESLRKRIKSGFQLISTDSIQKHELTFYSQGSFVMDTIIKPKDDDYDLDDGVYFLGRLNKKNRPEPQDFHEWIIKSIGEDKQFEKIIRKDTCVRVRYLDEFHIDLPSYYADNNEDPDLAHKEEGWVLSNPIKFIIWFEKQVNSGFQKGFLLESKLYDDYVDWTGDIRKKDVQLRRVVRYLKGWVDELRGDMPPGIVLTILAAENYQPDERDDISLKDTLVAIQTKLLSNGVKCPRPTSPKGEDLFEDYSETRKQYFMDRLNTFATTAQQAVATPNQKEACLKWQKHLGERFPCQYAKDEIDEANTYSQPVILGDSAKSAMNHG